MGEREYQKALEAAEVLKNFCMTEYQQGRCEECRIKDMCGAEPYTWDVE